MTKQRIELIQGFVKQIRSFLSDSSEKSVAINLLKHHIIELVGALNSTNVKLRNIA